MRTKTKNKRAGHAANVSPPARKRPPSQEGGLFCTLMRGGAYLAAIRCARRLPAYGAKIAPAALLCAAGHILPSSDERAVCPAYGAGIAPAAPFYVGTDGKAGMPSFARPAASGGHKSRISRRVCQLPAGSLLQRQTIPQPEPCGSGSSLYTREPAMRKKPARRA